MNELHLFAGAGGGILAGQLLGHTTVCAVEYEPYAQACLVARQNDKTFPPFPIWDDVRTFDGKSWRGVVDVVAGGFPCQDISAAGRGAGITGERSGLWGEMARIVGEVRPRYVFVENSPMLTTRGLGRVLGDLSEMGFDAEWCVLGADDLGAPHIRKRIWLLAKQRGFLPHSEHERTGWREQQQKGVEEEVGNADKMECAGNAYAESDSGKTKKDVLAGFGRGNCACRAFPDATSKRQPRQRQHKQPLREETQRKRQANHAIAIRQRAEWPPEPAVGRVVDGMANRSHRIAALGNGQVPRVAAAAFLLLKHRLEAHE